MDVDNISSLKTTTTTTTVVTTSNIKNSDSNNIGLYLNIDNSNNNNCNNTSTSTNNLYKEDSKCDSNNDNNNNNDIDQNNIINSNGYSYLLNFIKNNYINGNGNSGNTGNINKLKNNNINISPRNHYQNNNISNYNSNNNISVNSSSSTYSNNSSSNNNNNNNNNRSINNILNNINYNIYKEEINEDNDNYSILNNYIEIDLISDNPFKNYFQVKRYYNDNNTIEKKNIIVKVQKRNNKSLKELNVLEKVSQSNHSITCYGSYRGKSRIMKPRLLEYRDELLFIEMQDMARYQTLDMIIKRKKCKGSLTMARFIMRGILASAFYFESRQIIHQTLQPSNIYIMEDSLGTNDQSVVKFSNFEHCLVYSDINDRFVMGKDSVVHSIYSDRHQSRNLFKVVSENTISFTIGIIYLELLISTIYDNSINDDDYYNSFKEIIRNGKLDIIYNNNNQNNNSDQNINNNNNNNNSNNNINNNNNNNNNNNSGSGNKNIKYLKLSSNHQIEINELFEEDLKLISILIQDQNKRPNIKQFIIDNLLN